MALYSTLNISEVKSHNRFDAEFYKEEYQELEAFTNEGQKLSDISETVDLQSNGAFKRIFEILNDNNPKVVPYIRSGNVGDIFLETNDLQFISEKAHSNLVKTQTQNGDILMARKGKIGGATLIFPEHEGFNSNDNVVNIRLKNPNHLPEYFVVFWSTKFGLKQVERFATGNVQPWLSMKQLRMLKTVLVDMPKQQQIKTLLHKAYNELVNSNNFFKDVQSTIAGKLNFEVDNKGNLNKYIVSNSDLIKVRRMDAQCMNPEYTKYEDAIKNNSDYQYLRELIEPILKGTQQDAVSNGDINYASIKDIKNYEIVTNSLGLISESKNSLANKYDLLLAVTGATIGKIGIIQKYDTVTFSGDMLRLRAKNIDPYYLLAVLQSSVGQNQFYRWITGSTNGHLSPSDVAKTLIPRLGHEEEKIADNMKKYFSSKQKSVELIQTAINKVETWIEEMNPLPKQN
ncbi:hypothetical protein ACFSTA_20310 [Ornithinibacillus salinisoli]|uniref:Restriction endonuclease subunit S n=1 Tax=Ornithinibacillus salinisoli TaxID=1848459 RepID=A0ABW4W4E1_9BACI